MSGRYNMASKRTKRQYPQEDKDDICKRLKGGESVSNISNETGIPQSTLRDWRKYSTNTAKNNLPDKPKHSVKKSNTLLNHGFTIIPESIDSTAETGTLKKQRSLRSPVGNKDFTKWTDIIRPDASSSDKGWKRRPEPWLGYSKCEHLKDSVGLLELSVYKIGDEKGRRVVYIKDGKIKTLLTRFCQHGFQKSKEIDAVIVQNNVVSARWCYSSNETEAEGKIKELLKRYTYEWNKPEREDNDDQILQGDWCRWIKILSPEGTDEGWIKRDGSNYGYILEDIEELEDKYGVLETKVGKQIGDSDTINESEYYLQSGKIQTLAKGLCDNIRPVFVNGELRKGNDIWVRSKYVDPSTKEQARKVKCSHLDEFHYQCNGQKRYRESTEIDSYLWGNWEKVMVFKYDDGLHIRDNGNKGFWSANLDSKFEDTFGVFEIMIEQNNDNQVKFVDQGKVLSAVRQYCKDGSRKAIQINAALEEGCSLWIRCFYSSPATKEKSCELLTQLLEEYDYEWNKSLREKIDNLPGDWSDWITVMKPNAAEGWQRRDGMSKGYTRKNIDALFGSQFGVFEIKLHEGAVKRSNDCSGHEKDGKVVFVGAGDIHLEIPRCCKNTTRYISKYINNALEKGLTISVRYAYDKDDNDKHAMELASKLLERYDYPWIRKRREDVDDEISGTWSGWTKVLKPGQVEPGWTWRNKQYVGFMLQDLDSYFPNDISVYELAIEMGERNTVVHVGHGHVLETLKEYCDINKSDRLKGVQVSDTLSQGYGILVRYNLTVDSEAGATDIMRQQLERYDYRWNRTNREEVEDNLIQGNGWSEWIKIVIHDRARQHENQTCWIRRHKEQTGFRLSDEKLKEVIDNTKSGVYELCAQRDRRKVVVYVGKSKRLFTRISEYLERGSHKGNDIREALSLEYDIYARFMYTESEEDADKAENDLLTRYDYNWNDAKNENSKAKRNIMT